MSWARFSEVDMYRTGGTIGGAAGGGVLAFTGFPVLGALLIGITLLVVGVVMLRLTMSGQARRAGR